MSYSITKTDGQPFKTVEENNTLPAIYENVDEANGIILIGKLVAEYGEDQSNNFIRIIENFAHHIAPDAPLKGMLWYDTTEGALKVCTDNNPITWSKLLYIRTLKNSNAKTGDVYYDETSKEFYVYDENLNGENLGDWLLIGPNNYKHNIKYSTLLSTDVSSPTKSAIISVRDKDNCSYLVTIKIVAREKFSSERTRLPQSAAWICTLLIERYKQHSSDVYVTNIVGNYNTQTIAKTTGNIVEGWGFEPIINDEGDLVIGVTGSNGFDGAAAQGEDHIEWEIEAEILKV